MVVVRPVPTIWMKKGMLAVAAEMPDFSTLVTPPAMTKPSQ